MRKEQKYLNNLDAYNCLNIVKYKIEDIKIWMNSCCNFMNLNRIISAILIFEVEKWIALFKYYNIFHASTKCSWNVSLLYLILSNAYFMSSVLDVSNLK